MSNKITFRPNDSWRWYFDNSYDCLMLEIESDVLFRSRYPSKMLIPDVFDEFSFSVSDATAFYQFYDSCQDLDLTNMQKIELTINAIVAANFLKPQMPKSWYFIQQPMLIIPKLGELVDVYLQSSGAKLTLMVVEAGDTASVCVVAQANLKTETKIFVLAEVIKVMNDRLVTKHHNDIDELSSINFGYIS